MWNAGNCRLLLVLAWLLPVIAQATDVSVAGLFKGKATLVINGGAPHTLSVGQTSPEGVKLLAADSDTATVEIDGQRQTISLGERAAVISTAAPAGARKVTLYPDSRGHFITEGSVNGIVMRFMVDSGATQVVIPASQARDAGIDYLSGQLGITSTANGQISVYHVTLASVKVGDLELKKVPADIIETPMNEALLGMSFLGRLRMERDGQHLTLSQRDSADTASVAAADKSGHAKVVMKMQMGHFFTSGSINGGPVNFMIDTGASMVAISVADARRMGINYLHGTPGYTMTANGRATTYLMKFDEVKVGDIVLHNVDGAIVDGLGMPMALLGMSFLNRTDIQRDGNTMSLRQRF